MPDVFGLDDDEELEVVRDPSRSPFDNVPATDATAEDLASEEGTPDLLEEDLSPDAEAQAEPEPQQPEAQPTPVADPLAELVGEGRRYADPAALAGAYRSAEQLIGRQGQQMGDLQARQTQLEQMLRQAIGMIQAQPRPTPPPPRLDPEVVRAAEAAGLDENALLIAQTLAEQSAERHVAPLAASLQAEREAAMGRADAEQQARAAYQTQAGEISAFRTVHAADIAADPTLEDNVTAAFQALDVWEDDPLELSARNLEVAYEAARNPALLGVLQAVPDMMETDAGMTIARQLAQGTLGAAPQGTPAPAPPARPAAPPLPHVESGLTGPKPEQSTEDEWSVLKLVRDEHHRARSPLGI